MRYVLAEDEALEVGGLGANVAAAITATGLVDVVPAGNDRWRLVPRRRVGAVTVGKASIDGVEVVVAPKVGIARLLFLLGYASDPGFRPDDVTGTADDDLWPAVAETVCRHAERALQRGVLQGYVAVEEALPLVRGRIRMADQLARRPGVLMPVELRYDDYLVDTAENRILREAVRRLRGLPQLTLDLRARLRHLDARLDGVSPLVPGAALPRWHPNRVNERYHATLRLATLVLRHQSFELGPGGLRVASFVVDMARVFEQFVATALREAWRSYPGVTRAQFPVSLDVKGDVRMLADVVHSTEGRPRIVADAKYKLESGAGRYPNADHYQMLAYCTALAVPVGWLIYAQGSGGAVERTVRHTAVRIVERPLDLAAPPAELLDQIRRTAADAYDRVIRG